MNRASALDRRRSLLYGVGGGRNGRIPQKWQMYPSGVADVPLICGAVLRPARRGMAVRLRMH